MTLCHHCKERILAGDLVTPAEPPFHGEMHAECEPLWETDYYRGDLLAPWERLWKPYLASITGELTTPGGSVILPAS